MNCVNWYRMAKIKSLYMSDEEFKSLFDPKLEKVKSTLIESFYYHNIPKILDITMRGKKYSYLGVNQDVVERFKNSESKGKFFNQYIRNKYRRL